MVTVKKFVEIDSGQVKVKSSYSKSVCTTGQCFG